MTKMKRLILTVAAVIVSAAAFAQTSISIHENQTDGQIIPKEIYGQFSEHLGSCIYGGIWVGPDSPIPNEDGYRLDVLNALKELAVPVLRWPGGCFADDYHWMDGIGPQEQRTKISNNNWGGTMEDNSFGTHEFLNLCEKLGCEAYISGNVGSGTPEELAKWVEYMTSDLPSTVVDMRKANGREKAWKVKYLGIGNEAWGCGGNMFPEYYSSLFRRYTTYTRSYGDNHLYKIASGASDYDYNWTETLMKNIGTMMEGIAVHYYTVRDWNDKGSATDFTDTEYALTLSKAVDIDKCLQQHIKIMDRIDPEKKIDLLVDEWGTWYNVEPGTNPGHLFQQNTMRDAIVAALSLNIFHKYTDRIKMANIAQVVNVLQAMILTNMEGQMVLTPTYHAFEMYKIFQDAEFVPVENEAGLKVVKGETYPSVDVTAAKKDGSVRIALTNTDLKKDEKVVLSLDGKAKDVVARILTCNDIHECNTFDKPHTIEPHDYFSYKVKNGQIEVTVPAHSIVTLVVK